MLFNSLSFALFLPIVFVLYWFVFNGKLKKQNILLLVASYFFYACWDFRFLFLLIFSTLLDYLTGIKIEESSNQKSRKFWFWLSITINLGFLAVFKYYNFFIDSFADGLQLLNIQSNFYSLNLILPVGISFYTFHGLSYVIDIYQKKIKAEKNFNDYSLFVSFFPLLVAGPIERATHLLPQVKKEKTFDYAKAKDGLLQILWGLFKKVVIADSCAEYANFIFENSTDYNGSTLVLGAVFFAIQIYGDFSGYSDIAMGTARLLGFELLQNFKFPYFSRDIAEFWRRWHISLSSWFRDYLYIPLGGSAGGTWMKIRNTFIIFLVSGFWHGANWTFIAWGFLNAVFIIPSILLNTNRNNIDVVAKESIFPSFKEFSLMITTFSLTVFAWIFFRANSISHAFQYIQNIFNSSLFSAPVKIPSHTISFQLILLIILFFGIEWWGRKDNHALQNTIEKYPKKLRLPAYYLIAILVLVYASEGKEQQFIYFQF